MHGPPLDARQQQVLDRIEADQAPLHRVAHRGCQSAFNIDPQSACKIDPLSDTAEVVPVVNRGTRRGFV